MEFRGRILLVEDDMHDRAHLLKALNALGLDADFADSLDGGLRKDLQHEYVGAVVDLSLSASSQCEGFDLVAALRHYGRQYPIIIASRNSGAAYEIRGYEVGANGYMVKWPPADTMQRQLAKLLLQSPS